MLIAARNAFMTRLLPYDAELEYLESTGTQWIDTGLNYFADFEIGIKLRESVANKALGLSTNYCMERIGSGTPYWRLVVNSTSYGTSASVVDYHIISFKGGIFAVDGVAVHTLSNPFASGTMTLFGVIGTFRPNIIYACKLWDANGVLVRDFIPVRRGTTGYLYDRVTRRLFGNAGTGDFVLGPDVVPVEYIQQTGTQYIDTLYPTADTRREVITVDWSGHSTTNREYMAGAASGSYLIELSANGYYGTAPTNLSSIQVSQKDRIRWDYTVGSKPSLYINDVFAINDTLVRVPTGNIMTGGVGSSGVNFPKMKIYGLDIFTNTDEQVRKMLPVRVGTDATSWEGAMIDTLTRRVYRNQGTGAFGYGNDLRYPIPAE